ncbi:MAG TPA: hypothetical protein VGO53_16565 [Steroidobacteraceae bacterium]|jgi:hypothetical protein|nr:hypothetical protein [Steroidobacteraceae bacterium]
MNEPSPKALLMWELGCATGKALDVGKTDPIASDLATVLIVVSAAYSNGDRHYMDLFLAIANTWPLDPADSERVREAR